MSKIFRPRNILITTLILLLGSLIFLFFDAFYGGKTFRTMQDKISSSENVDLTGLRELKASGGDLPRFPYISWKLNHVKEDKIILDLKGEFHGYVYGIPTTFFSFNQSKAPGVRHLLRRFIVTGTTEIQPDLVTPEELESPKYGFSYAKVDIGCKFIASDENIDEIVNVFDNLKENNWIHIHCSQGHGRTSVALVMLDIMRNAPQVSLADIVKRQHLLGSVNLFDTNVWARGSYTKAELEQRKQFLKKFYEFVNQRKNGGIQKWSEWNKQYSSAQL